MKPPIDLKILKHCSKAEISEESKIDSDIKDLHIGEFFDVYCVANNKKPLAALDFSTYGINKLRKLDKKLINKVIDYCNCKGIQALHNKQRGGMYLKTVFFLPRNYEDALKLMDVLWSGYSQNVKEHQFMIGKLLGYSDKDIKYFIKRNYNKNITASDIKKYKKKLKKNDVTLEDLQEDHGIIHLEKIKNI